MIGSTEWYRIFLLSAEFSNFTRAAQLLHMTQPSVSYVVKQLEAALGVKLFDRLPKGVRLTPQGQELYLHVRQAFEQLESAERHIENLKQFRTGQLRIGANGAIVKDSLLPVLDRFHARHPDIRIKLSQEKTATILGRLKQGELDIGYVYLPVKDEEIEIVESYTSPFCVVVGATLRDLSLQPVSTERLIELPLLMLSPGSTTRSCIEEWFQSQGLEAEADFELNSLEMLAEFVERGYGVAFLPRDFVISRIFSGMLVEIRTEVPLPVRHIGVAIRTQSSLSLTAKAYIEMLNESR